MQVEIITNKKTLGRFMAERGADTIRKAIARDGDATIVVATGASQFEVLEALVAARDIDWGKVTAFHLDEYVALPATHAASFRRYLHERFVSKLPSLKEFVEVVGDAADLRNEISRLNDRMRAVRVAVCFAGIGENGHLAFNDPPADFDTCDAYLTVKLDEACRRQQLGEGWFQTLENVPTQAVSMSIRQIMASEQLLITAPDLRKAAAVKNVIEGPLTNMCPASILRLHRDCLIGLDPLSSSTLSVMP